jgi:hypothetical protein
MKYLFIICFLTVSVSIWGQQMFEEKLDNCTTKFQLENNEITLHYKTGDSLMILDIIEGADVEQIYKLKGVLAAQLAIDSAGNPCLVSYDTKFNTIRKPFEVEENLNSMSHWEGTGSHKFISVIFRLFFEKRQITVQRLGYNRNKGWNLLSSETYNKKEPEKKEK